MIVTGTATLVEPEVALATVVLNVIVCGVVAPTQPGATLNEKTAESVRALSTVVGVTMVSAPVAGVAVMVVPAAYAALNLIVTVTGAAGPVAVLHVTVIPVDGLAVSAPACREPMQTVNASNARKIGTR